MSSDLVMMMMSSTFNTTFDDVITTPFHRAERDWGGVRRACYLPWLHLHHQTPLQRSHSNHQGQCLHCCTACLTYCLHYICHTASQCIIMCHNVSYCCICICTVKLHSMTVHFNTHTRTHARTHTLRNTHSRRRSSPSSSPLRTTAPQHSKPRWPRYSKQ